MSQATSPILSKGQVSQRLVSVLVAIDDQYDIDDDQYDIDDEEDDVNDNDYNDISDDNYDNYDNGIVLFL